MARRSKLRSANPCSLAPYKSMLDVSVEARSGISTPTTELGPDSNFDAVDSHSSNVNNSPEAECQYQLSIVCRIDVIENF